MKKSLLALALAFTTSLSVAQTQVALPSEPMFTSVSTVSPNAVAALASPNTNSVFIDQSGSMPSVSILQDGSGNKSGTVASPVYLRGTNQSVQINQTGVQNTIALSAKNLDTGASVGASIQLRQIGNNNTMDISCGVGATSDGGINLTGCNSADMNAQFVGNSNSIQFRGTGDNLVIQYNVSGNGNQFFVDTVGSDHSQTVAMIGDNNTMNVIQISTLGSSILVDSWGSGNDFSIRQSGSISSVLHLKNVSTSGSFNIIQRN